jgi:hypothetical protein
LRPLNGQSHHPGRASAAWWRWFQLGHRCNHDHPRPHDVQPHPGRLYLAAGADNDSAPHLRAGEFAIVDTTDTEPQHGEVYLVRFHRRSRWPRQVEEVRYIQQITVRHYLRPGGGGETFTGFAMQCLNFKPYVEAVQRTPGMMPEISHRSMAFPVLRKP